jgi:hypothetical protein
MIGERGGMTFGSPTSGWVDGYRNRLFEYPRISVNLARGPVPATFIADPHKDPAKKRWLTFNDAGQTDWWFVDDFERRLLWNEPPYAGTRFPLGLRDHWTRHPGAGATTNDDRGNYRLYMTPKSGSNESDVVDLLFPATHLTDSWDRSWIFCDHVIAALHIEALRLAKRRREGTDVTFNSISTTAGVGYISLDGMVGNAGPAQATPPELGQDQADTKFFSNGLVPESDLEVGDHIIFWNCFAYSYVSEGDWQLENTVIMDVDSDPRSGSQHRGQLALQGHGTSILLYSRYIDSIRKYFQSALTKLQAKVKKFAHDKPAETHMRYKSVEYRIIKWSPYEDFDAPGAWWVQISSDDWGKDDAKAAASIGLSVARDPTPGTGYNPPPGPGWVQFPLFQPAIAGGWKAYLDRRRGDPTYLPHTHHLPGKLADVVVHAENMPGLFHDAPVGFDLKVPCVRPRVAP